MNHTEKKYAAKRIEEIANQKITAIGNLVKLKDGISREEKYNLIKSGAVVLKPYDETGFNTSITDWFTFEDITQEISKLNDIKRAESAKLKAKVNAEKQRILDILWLGDVKEFNELITNFASFDISAN